MYAFLFCDRSLALVCGRPLWITPNNMVVLAKYVLMCLTSYKHTCMHTCLWALVKFYSKIHLYVRVKYVYTRTSLYCGLWQPYQEPPYNKVVCIMQSISKLIWDPFHWQLYARIYIRVKNVARNIVYMRTILYIWAMYLHIYIYICIYG